MNTGKEVAVKRTISEVQKFPEFQRTIAETGEFIRDKAIELELLPREIDIPSTRWINKGLGIGAKDFDGVSKDTLHTYFDATFVSWCVTDENGAVVLKSAAYRDDIDCLYV